MDVRLISDEAAELGEGPRLDARTGEVLWVDIMAGRLDPADAPRLIAATVLAAYAAPDLL